MCCKQFENETNPGYVFQVSAFKECFDGHNNLILFLIFYKKRFKTFFFKHVFSDFGLCPVYAWFLSAIAPPGTNIVYLRIYRETFFHLLPCYLVMSYTKLNIFTLFVLLEFIEGHVRLIGSSLHIDFNHSLVLLIQLFN